MGMKNHIVERYTGMIIECFRGVIMPDISDKKFLSVQSRLQSIVLEIIKESSGKNQDNETGKGVVNG